MRLAKVDYDPFADSENKPSYTLKKVDYDPFGEKKPAPDSEPLIQSDKSMADLKPPAIVDGRKYDKRVQLSKTPEGLEPPKEEEFDAAELGSAAGVAHTIESAGSNVMLVGDILRKVGEQIDESSKPVEQKGYYEEGDFNTPTRVEFDLAAADRPKGPVGGALQSKGADIADLGKKVWDYGNGVSDYLAKEYPKADITKNPEAMLSPGYWAREITEQGMYYGPQLLAAMIPGVGAGAATAVGVLNEGGAAYGQFKDEGEMSESEAIVRGLGTLAVFAALNKIPFDRLIKKDAVGLRRKATKMLSQGTVYALDEWLEEVGEAVAASIGHDDFWQKVGDAAIQGINVIPASFAMGGASGALSGVGKNQDGQNGAEAQASPEPDPQADIDAIKAKLIPQYREVGFPEGMIEQLVDAAANNDQQRYNMLMSQYQSAMTRGHLKEEAAAQPGRLGTGASPLRIDNQPPAQPQEAVLTENPQAAFPSVEELAARFEQENPQEWREVLRSHGGNAQAAVSDMLAFRQRSDDAQRQQAHEAENAAMQQLNRETLAKYFLNAGMNIREAELLAEKNLADPRMVAEAASIVQKMNDVDREALDIIYQGARQQAVQQDIDSLDQSIRNAVEEVRNAQNEPNIPNQVENADQEDSVQGPEAGRGAGVQDEVNAEVSPDELVDRARSGDKDAQSKLDEYGIDHKEKPVYRYISEEEKAALERGETIEGKNKDVGVDVTFSDNPDNVPHGTNGKLYRVKFKPTDRTDHAKSKTDLRNKNETDGWLRNGYSMDDVEAVEEIGDSRSAFLSVEAISQQLADHINAREKDETRKRKPSDFAQWAEQIAEAFENKDAAHFRQVLSHGRGFNDASKKVFFGLIGKPVPSNIAGIQAAIDEWAGITQEQRQEMERQDQAERDRKAQEKQTEQEKQKQQDFIDSIDGENKEAFVEYAQNLKPLYRGKAVKTMNKQIRDGDDNRVKTRREFIEERVKAGWHAAVAEQRKPVSDAKHKKLNQELFDIRTGRARLSAEQAKARQDEIYELLQNGEKKKEPRLIAPDGKTYYPIAAVENKYAKYLTSVILKSGQKQDSQSFENVPGVGKTDEAAKETPQAADIASVSADDFDSLMDEVESEMQQEGEQQTAGKTGSKEESTSSKKTAGKGRVRIKVHHQSGIEPYGGGVIEIEGTPVTIKSAPSDYEYVAYKRSDNKWRVVEKSTGLSIGDTTAETKAGAISKANANAEIAGEDKFRKAMRNADIINRPSDTPKPQKKTPFIPKQEREAEKQRGERNVTPLETNTRSADEIIQSAAKHGVKGIDEAVKGLHELFGGGTKGKLGMGVPVDFDKDTYAKAKPHFEKALNEFVSAGRDLKAFIRWAMEQFGTAIKPYLKQFHADLSKNNDANTEKSGRDGVSYRQESSENEVGNDGRNSAADSDGGQEAALLRMGDRRSGAEDDAGVLGAQSTEDVSGSQAAQGSQTSRKGSRRKNERGDGQQHGLRDAADGRNGTGGAQLVSDGAGGRELDGGPGRDSVSGVEDGVTSVHDSNYHITDPESLVGGGPKAKFERNRRAIEVFQQVEAEGRAPTAEERDAIAAYIGWGSFGQELFNGSWDRPQPKEGWQKENAWLREHLGEAAWKSAQQSILNAHYTDPPTVTAMWDMLRRMGFKGGRVLEPSMGIGNFFGLMPRDMMEKSQLTGIELDEMTGRMAQMLYPDANIQIKGYEKSQTPDNFYDLVIGNWPFAAQGPADRRYNKLAPTLHDYFFLKALDQVRPGGLVVGITSSGTMDKLGQSSRLEMSKKADLVASFRLPTGAFGKYAGTAVVTDIIILKKKEDAGIGQVPSWVETVEMDTPAGPSIRVNRYYAENPENVLGTLNYSGTTRGRAGMIVDRPADYEQRLVSLFEKVPQKAYSPDAKKQRKRYVTNNAGDRVNSVLVGDDGKLYVSRGEAMELLEDVVSMKVKKPGETMRRRKSVMQLVKIRKVLGSLIDQQREGHPDTENTRAELRKLYRDFVKKYGNISNSFALKQALKRVNDPHYAQLAALEHNAAPKGKRAKYEEAAIITRSTMRARQRPENLSVRDAYVFQRNEDLDFDEERIAELSKQPVEKVLAELSQVNAIYQTPAGNWEHADTYLSGNVRKKLREARAAKEMGVSGMDKNIAALENVVPEDIPYYNIEAKLGNNWTPPKVYRQFVAEMLAVDSETALKYVSVSFSPQGWKVRLDRSLEHRPEAQSVWGTEAVSFGKLMTHAMRNTPIVVRVKDYVTGTLVVDEAASAQANEKKQSIQEEFTSWVWKSPKRRIELERAYNESFNSVALPTFSGDFLSFEGMMLERGEQPFNLRQHQISAIARGLITGRGLYAHEVGTGKTYTMGGIAVESRRYGKARKPVIFAHNANSATVAAEINEMYPGAKVLYVDNLSKDNKEIALAQIINEEWDAIVVPHSMADKFALRTETYEALAAEEIAELEAAALDAAKEDNVTLDVDMMDDEEAMKKVRSPTAKDMVRARNKIKQRIEKMSQKAAEDAIILEDAGIDMIIVDEAHEFKKPPIATTMRMKGLNTAASNRSINLMFMLQYVNGINNGRGVHLFTGTPITNTLNEIYNMMRFVMPTELKDEGVAHWDSWFNTFADETTDVEVTAAGDYQPVSRLASFVNVPELRLMAGQYMDTVFADEMPEFRDRQTKSGKTMKDKLTKKERQELINGRTENPQGRPYKIVKTVVAPMTSAQRAIRHDLMERAQRFRNATKKERKRMILSGDPAMPLLVETDASKAGLDARMYDMGLADDPGSKVNRAVDNIIQHYEEHPKSTQAVFMEIGFHDFSTATENLGNGKKRRERIPAFNLSKDVVEKLVKRGIPREQIAVVKGTTSKKKRQEIALAMNRGDIRVVIGSTRTLGTGVNMQENLRAMHHLDAPWRPGDLEQRNGRGHRQGNKWNSVMEYRYVTEGIDGRRWQVLVVKDKFIKKFLRNEGTERIIEGDAASIDDDAGGNDLASTLSDATGDPRILQIEKAKKDIQRLQRRERLHAEGIAETASQIERLKDEIKRLESRDIPDMEETERLKQQAGKEFSVKIEGVTFDKMGEAEDRLADINDKSDPADERKIIEVGTYKGHVLEMRPNYNPDGTALFSLKLPGGNALGISSASLRGLDAVLRNNTKRLTDARRELQSKTESIARLEKNLDEPFPQEKQLEAAMKRLEQLEADIQMNPVPPPSWLRQPTPIDSEVMYDGQPRKVVGHKWSDSGYYVVLAPETGSDSKENTDAPYTDVMDEQGMQVYDHHDFKAPAFEREEATPKLSEIRKQDRKPFKQTKQPPLYRLLLRKLEDAEKKIEQHEAGELDIALDDIEKLYKRRDDLMRRLNVTETARYDATMNGQQFPYGYTPASRPDTFFAVAGDSGSSAVESEMQDIVERAKADGTYMLAPNGERSNLNERQWAQVRTKAFKDWFGDWLLLEKLSVKSEMGKADAERALDRIIKEKKGVLVNTETGIQVSLSKNSANKIISNEALRKSLENGFTSGNHDAVASKIDVLFENATKLFDHADKNNDVNVAAIHRFGCPVVINGEVSVAYMTVKESIQHGKRMYSLELTEIEKLAGRLAKAAIGNTKPTASSSMRKLHTMANSVNPALISKVVDENGEPLVVYHGSRSDVSEFRSDRPQFFTDKSSVAGAYSMRFGGESNSEAQKAINSEFDALRAKLIAQGVNQNDVHRTQEWQKLQEKARIVDSTIYPEFLNIKEPKDVKPGDADFDEALNGKDDPAYHEQLEFDGYDGLIMRDVVDLPLSYKSEDAQSAAQKQTVFTPTKPNQIKSATGNVGMFDGENPDIRYSASQKAINPAAVREIRQAVGGAAQVHDTWDSIPAALRSRLERSKKRQGIDGRIKGFIHQGEIHLVAENLDGIEDATETLGHELMHRGIGILDEKRRNMLLDEIFKGRPGIRKMEYRRAARTVSENYGFDDSTAQGRRMIAEEIVAHAYRARQTKPALWRRVLNAVRNALADFFKGTALENWFKRTPDQSIEELIRLAVDANDNYNALKPDLKKDTAFSKRYRMSAKKASGRKTDITAEENADREGVLTDSPPRIEEYAHEIRFSVSELSPSYSPRKHRFLQTNDRDAQKKLETLNQEVDRNLHLHKEARQKKYLPNKFYVPSVSEFKDVWMKEYPDKSEDEFPSELTGQERYQVQRELGKKIWRRENPNVEENDAPWNQPKNWQRPHFDDSSIRAADDRRSDFVRSQWPGTRMINKWVRDALHEAGVNADEYTSVGSDSTYYTVISDDEMDSLTMRVSNHATPPGGGFNVITGASHGESDILVDPEGLTNWKDAVGELIKFYKEKANRGSDRTVFSKKIPAPEGSNQENIESQKGQARFNQQRTEEGAPRIRFSVKRNKTALRRELTNEQRQMLDDLFNTIAQESEKTRLAAHKKVTGKPYEKKTKTDLAVQRSVKKESNAEQKQADAEKLLSAHEKITGKKYEKNPKPLNILRSIFRAGKEAYKEKGLPKMAGDAVDAFFSQLEKEYHGRLAKHEGALLAVHRALQQIDENQQKAEGDYNDPDLRKYYDQEGISLDDLKARYAKHGLQALMGENRYGYIRRATKGDVDKTIDIIKDRLQYFLARYYSKAARDLVGKVDPKTLYNDRNASGMDYANQWRKELEAVAKEDLRLRRNARKGALTGDPDDYVSAITVADRRAEELRNAEGYLRKLRKRNATPQELEKQEKKVETLREGIEEMIRSVDWPVAQKLYYRLKEIRAQSNLMKGEVIMGNRYVRQQFGDDVAASIAARYGIIEESNEKNPTSRSLRRTIFVDGRGDMESWALALGGDQQSTAYKVMYEALRNGNTKALTDQANAHKKLHDIMTALEYSEKDLVSMMTKQVTVEFNGTAHKFTVAQLMDLYALTLDEEAAQKLYSNGFKSETKRGQNVITVDNIIDARGPEVMQMQIASIANTQLDNKQRELVRQMVDIVTEMGEKGNDTAMKLWGREKFFSEAHWRLRTDRTDNQAFDPKSMDDMKSYIDMRLDKLGMLRERVSHSHPLMIGNVFEVFYDQIHDMSNFTHLTIPSLDALSVINNSMVKDTMIKRLGTKYAPRMKAAIARLAGLDKYSEHWNPVQRLLGRVERNSAVAILGWRISSVLNNRIGGSILLGSELGKIAPKLKRQFNRSIGPVSFWSKKNREIRDQLMNNGYFYARWFLDPARTYANLPVDNAEAHSKSQKELRKRRWQAKSMHWMAQAEIRNTIAAYKVLTKNGYEPGKAIEMLEAMTRRTQNPSTALEETGAYSAIKASGMGIFVPFYGQPSVAGNMLLKDMIEWREARRTGKGVKEARKNMARSLIALVENAVYNISFRMAVKLAADGILYNLFFKGQGPDDDEKEKMAIYSTMGLASELIDIVVPGAGRVVDGIAYGLYRGIKTWERKKDPAKLMEIPFAVLAEASGGIEDNLLARELDKLSMGGKNAVRGLSEDEWWKLEKGIMDLVEGGGMATGSPVGGVIQALRVGAGLSGHPLGKKPPGEKKKRKGKSIYDKL